MLSTLTGFIKLWSAPAIKLLLLAGVVLSSITYVFILQSKVQQQLLEIEALDSKLISKQHEIESLTVSVDNANNATNQALAELLKVDRLAVQRANKLKELTLQLSHFENELNELGTNNENIKVWFDHSIPGSVISLLEYTRDSNSNSANNKEGSTTTAVDAELR